MLLDEPDLVVCIEAKWGEDGMGSCSCARDSGEASPGEGGRCSARVLERHHYWEAAELMGLPARADGEVCPIATGYQAVRNVAAALALGGGRRRAVFALLYDGRNPYFAGVAESGWPGWPRVLEHTLQPMRDAVEFRHRTWQDLLGRLPLDRATTEWALAKHRLSTGHEHIDPEPAEMEQELWDEASRSPEAKPSEAAD